MKLRIPIALGLLILTNSAMSTMRIVLSAALTDAHFEFRKQQYIESLRQYAQYGYDVYVVEALKKQGMTFLDDYCKHVFYATSNNPNYRNNGINEASTMLEGVCHFDFDPEDMIVKVTGRYQLESDFFLKLIENNPDYDAFVKVNEYGDVFTLGFAMRCKYFKDMYASMNYESMERNWINVEHEVGNYIKRKVKEGNFKVFYVERLHITGNLYGSSTAPGISAEQRSW